LKGNETLLTSTGMSDDCEYSEDTDSVSSEESVDSLEPLDSEETVSPTEISLSLSLLLR